MISLRGRSLSAHRAFLGDVIEGLSRPRKQLPCKYFYDERGGELFDQICDLEEYYPTRTELSILQANLDQIAHHLGPRCGLIEFGSGSGLKTRLLLARLEQGVYYPVDINARQLAKSAGELQREFPSIEIVPIEADFTQGFNLIASGRAINKRVVYFSGSTIGNFKPPQVRALLAQIALLVGRGGGLLIGVDLKKDRAILERAYDDESGVTAAFNRNLLVRINRELGANFDLEAFQHRAFYNELRGRIEMHLVSRREQQVLIGRRCFQFKQNETICTEFSYKFTVEQFAEIAGTVGLNVREVWRDPVGLFSVQYAEA